MVFNSYSTENLRLYNNRVQLSVNLATNGQWISGDGGNEGMTETKVILLVMSEVLVKLVILSPLVLLTLDAH